MTTDIPTPPTPAGPDLDWSCWRDPAHAVREQVFGWPRCTDCGAGPSYADRFDHVLDHVNVGVYVPAPATPTLGAIIAPRSAIVAFATSDGPVTASLEGWINGPAQYGDRDARGLWEAGVEHAAGRLVVDYPTAGKMFVELDELTRVGTFWPRSKRIEVTDEDALAAWLS